MDSYSERLKKLNELKEYIQTTESRVENILKNLNWTKENTLKRFNKETQIQKTKSFNGDRNGPEPEYPESSDWKHSIKLDSTDMDNVFSKFKKIIPKSLPNKFSDMQVNFDGQQKLAIYEYVIGKTGKITEPEVSILATQEEDPKTSNKKMTFAEIVALRRDLKRRRLKYRIGKAPPLSTTEEMKNLIQIQMQALNEYWNQKYKKNKLEDGDYIIKDQRKYTSKNYLMNDNANASRTRSRSRDWDKTRNRINSVDKTKYPAGTSRSRSRNRYRNKSRSRHNSRNRSTSRNRHRSKIRNRSRNKSRKKSRSESRNRNNHTSYDSKSRDRYRSKSASRSYRSKHKKSSKSHKEHKKKKHKSRDRRS